MLAATDSLLERYSWCSSKLAKAYKACDMLAVVSEQFLQWALKCDSCEEIFRLSRMVLVSAHVQLSSFSRRTVCVRSKDAFHRQSRRFGEHTKCVYFVHASQSGESSI